MVVITEFLIKKILSEEIFGVKLCESVEQINTIDFVYTKLLTEGQLLFGEPITVPELRKLLRQKILNFEFIKLDGTVRPAKGTLMMRYVPQSQHPKGIRPSSPKVATFYDLKKSDWRCVSQRSKEIVLKQDTKTKKPIVVILDKPKITPEIGKTYEFDKLSKNKYNINTYITVTRKDKDGFWGKTSGSNVDILLNADRLKRLGPELQIGETYEFTKLDKNSNKVFSKITLTKKDEDGYWGKTDGSEKDILLTNERLKRLGTNVKELTPKEKEEGEPETKETPTPSIDKKLYHFRNKVTGATVDFATDETGAQNKIKSLGGNWEIVTDDELDSKDKPQMMADEDIEEKE